MFIRKNPKGLPVGINGNKVAVMTTCLDTIITFTKDGQVLFLVPDYTIFTETIFIEDNIELLQLKMFSRDDKENPVLVLQFAVGKDADRIHLFR